MPTKAQWAEVETQLSHSYGSVELLCDGYKVHAEIKSIAPLKQGIVVYVNGVFKGEWMKGDAEEAKKFHREMKRYLYSAKAREAAAKSAKRRHLGAVLKRFFTGAATRSISHWSPWWTNPKAFTRHLRKTCADIQIVKIGY